MIYGFLNKQEKEHVIKLLTLEINGFLKRIYKTMKRTVPLKLPVFKQEQIILKNSQSATKSFEFKLNDRDQVKEGNIGKVITVTNGIREVVQTIITPANFVDCHCKKWTVPA